MGGAIAGPSSEELGYVRRGERRDTGDKAPQDMQRRRPGWRWISIGVILALVALIGFYGTSLWIQVDRNALAADAVGTWVQSGSVGSVLVITGDLSFEGSVDGREVRGAVAVPTFPSMSTTLHLTLLGRRWDLRLQSPHVMTLTDSSGRVITFWGA